MNKIIKRIAIVRLSALGDIVNSAVVLQFISKKYKNAKIEWITEEVFAPLLRGHPLIYKVHTVNLKRLKKEKSLSLFKETIQKLNSLEKFDIVIDMQGLLKSALVAKIIDGDTHGYSKSSAREFLASYFYKTTSTISYLENIVTRNCFVVANGLGFDITDEMILNKKAIFEFTRIETLQKKKKNIAIVIGASWDSKIYPKESIVKLCNTLQENSILIWGNDKEKEDAEWISKNSQYAKVADKMSLVELVSFISNMDLLIGNDTGPTHMAWAQNIPSITLFGPTNSRMIFQTPINIAIESPSDVDIMKIDKNDYSIKEIKVTTIVNRAEELLNNGI